MQKIHSLYLRDKANPKLVTREPDPKCTWVLRGHGVATVKHNGTACLVEAGMLYRRLHHKAANGAPPEGWVHWSGDPKQTNGHGWLPVQDCAEDRYHLEAWNRPGANCWNDGTYELVGPKVQGNPYALTRHHLIRHGAAKLEGVPRSYDDLAEWMAYKPHPFEGVVWHWKQADGSLWYAKIKRSDFGL